MEKVKLIVALPIILINKIDTYCKEKGYTRTQFITMVLNQFFD